jgi:uncharacterized repeat protein (TIGR03803 family)
MGQEAYSANQSGNRNQAIMKRRIKNLFVLPALIAGLGLILTSRVTAQNFTTLHSFTNNPDGANPYAGLILSGNTLYGTTQFGGSSNIGTVFAVNTDGTGYTNLYSFIGSSYEANPRASLILSGNTLYGTATYGGGSGNGTVFAINTNGMGFTNLYSFTGGNDGANPFDGLILSGSTLYGTVFNGGSSYSGTLFAVNTNGTGFTNLYIFTGGSDGGNPFAGLILSGNILYGTAEYDGSSGRGTVFAINTNGMGFTNLYSFTAAPYPNFTNSDGGNPFGGLILSGNTLYGTAAYAGSLAYGTVFKVNTDGTGFTNLYSFTGGNDGATPEAGLILSGNTLYGTARLGGSYNGGTVFAINTDGTGFTNVYSFTGGSDGATPLAKLILSGNTLYGTTYAGGDAGNGTVFSLSLPPASVPQLTIIPFGANVILTWPANATGFTLEFATNLISPAVWSTNLPSPVVVNSQNTVTNAIFGALGGGGGSISSQEFFRLRSTN